MQVNSSSDSERKLNLFLCSRPPNTVGKGTLRSCSYSSGCKEKHTGRTKFVVFHLLIGLIAVAVTVAFVVQDLSMCVDDYESEHILVKTPAIFSLVRYICYSRFGPLMNCFVSPGTEIWVERQKKVRCFRKNKFKETNRVE